MIEGVQKRLITDRAEWLRWRLVNVNASEAAALFADELVEMVHPRLTAFELWAVKSGRVVEAFYETPDMRRGRSLERNALEMMVEDTGWTVLPGDSYYHHPAWRIGATPDSFLLRPDREGTGICQVKTVNEHAWRRYWLNKVTGEVEVPLYVAIQTSVEAFLTGNQWAIVAALEMGKWKVHVLDVEIVPPFLDKLRELVDDFWARVASGDFYPPNWSHDADLIRRIFASAKENREADLRGDNLILDQLAQYEALSARISDGSKAEKERKELQAKILLRVRDAERALLPDGRTLLAPTVRRPAHQVKEAVWRQFSVKKESRA